MRRSSPIESELSVEMKHDNAPVVAVVTFKAIYDDDLRSLGISGNVCTFTRHALTALAYHVKRATTT
ncbi:MAG: hypothetical protein ABJB66_09785 [Gemmatimonadaceae bacterium]